MISGLQHLQNYNSFKLFYYVLCWPNNNTHTYTCNPHPKQQTNQQQQTKTHTHTKIINKTKNTPTNITNKQKTLLCKSVCYSCFAAVIFVCWDQKQHCLSGKSLGKGETITGFSVWQVRVWRSFHTTCKIIYLHWEGSMDGVSFLNIFYYIYF